MRDQLGGAVPEADQPLVVEQEDPVADGIEDSGRVLALGSGRFGSRPRGRLGLGRLVEARVAGGSTHQPHEALGELQLFLVVLRVRVHQLDDADDLALVLDGHHHRGANAGRSLLRHLPHLPFSVNVVVDAAGLLDLRGNVVDEQRLSGGDHAALHAAALTVDRQGREDRRIELLAVDPGVLAGDQLGRGIESRDDDSRVRDRVLEQLVEAGVDALRLERLVEVASG